MTIDFQKNLKKEQKKIKSAKQKTLTNSLSTNKKKEIESLKKKPLTNSSSTNQKKKLNKKSRRSSKLKNKTKKKGGALSSSQLGRKVSPISNVFSNMVTKSMSEPKLILSSVDNYIKRINEITEFSQLNILMELEKEIKASSLLSDQEKKTLQEEIQLKTKDYQSLYTLFKVIYNQFRSISLYKKTDVIESKLNDLSNDLSRQWLEYKEAEEFISEEKKKVESAFKLTTPDYEKTVVPIFEEIQKQFKKTRDILSTNSNLIKEKILSSSSMEISDKIIYMKRLNEIGINDYIKDIKGLEVKIFEDFMKSKFDSQMGSISPFDQQINKNNLETILYNLGQFIEKIINTIPLLAKLFHDTYQQNAYNFTQEDFFKISISFLNEKFNIFFQNIMNRLNQIMEFIENTFLCGQQKRFFIQKLSNVLSFFMGHTKRYLRNSTEELEDNKNLTEQQRTYFNDELNETKKRIKQQNDVYENLQRIKRHNNEQMESYPELCTDKLKKTIY